ncbi:STAS domain-containing protein [Actinokineospora bangkokensis]|uniref:STAS domain-containing protein n=1 Tax=Actinokineospora bangkokensis TaxID=1193682 RepID=A0A1Q9LLS4_9PSEU|nr:STAS domain-containing protein [Actinokineospora bangkokensis]OLR92965.1 hypothetical protein BJP25_18535 [Actinokineospora bangkokensis]
MRAPLAEITTSRDGDRAVVRVRGEIDMSNGDQFTAAVHDAAAQGAAAQDAGPPARTVVVDLSSTTYFASAGLAALVSGANRCAADGVVFQVVAPPRSAPRRVVELTRLHEVFPVLDALPDSTTGPRAAAEHGLR